MQILLLLFCCCVSIFIILLHLCSLLLCEACSKSYPVRLQSTISVAATDPWVSFSLYFSPETESSSSFSESLFRIFKWTQGSNSTKITEFSNAAEVKCYHEKLYHLFSNSTNQIFFLSAGDQIQVLAHVR